MPKLMPLLVASLMISCGRLHEIEDSKKDTIKNAMSSIGIDSDIDVSRVDDSVSIEVILPNDRWYDKYTLSEIGSYLLMKAGYTDEQMVCFNFVVNGRLNEGGRLCLPHDAINTANIRFSNPGYMRMFEHLMKNDSPDNFIYMGVGLNAFSNATSGKFNERNIWNIIFKYSSKCDSSEYRVDFERLIKVLEYEEFSVDTRPLHDLMNMCQ